MSRPLRVLVTDGGYHLTARGQSRQRICEDVRGYRDFVSRQAEMSGRYGWEVHGCALMPNRYRLIARNPEAHPNEAMQ